MTTLSNIAMPAGFVFPFAGTSIPDGFLLCDGSAVSRAAYSKLFAAIGTAYGVGNGSTTFNLPDLVGYFIKGGTPDGVKNADTTKPNGLTVGSTTPGATGSTTPGATGSTTPGATGGPSAASESTTPGATGGPSAASESTTPGNGGYTSNNHTHSVASSGGHNHSAYYVGNVALSSGGSYSIFCANNTGATYNVNVGTGEHTHSTGNASADHRHTGAAHTHGLNSHTHTSAAHTHGLNSHTHTSAAHTHTSAAHTHTSAAHAHALTGDAETAPKNVKMNYLIKT